VQHQLYGPIEFLNRSHCLASLIRALLQQVNSGVLSATLFSAFDALSGISALEIATIHPKKRFLRIWRVNRSPEDYPVFWR
jgi:hypothetical protein